MTDPTPITSVSDSTLRDTSIGSPIVSTFYSDTPIKDWSAKLSPDDWSLVDTDKWKAHDKIMMDYHKSTASKCYYYNDGNAVYFSQKLKEFPTIEYFDHTYVYQLIKARPDIRTIKLNIDISKCCSLPKMCHDLGREICNVVAYTRIEIHGNHSIISCEQYEKDTYNILYFDSMSDIDYIIKVCLDNSDIYKIEIDGNRTYSDISAISRNA